MAQRQRATAPVDRPHPARGLLPLHRREAPELPHRVPRHVQGQSGVRGQDHRGDRPGRGRGVQDGRRRQGVRARDAHGVASAAPRPQTVLRRAVVPLRHRGVLGRPHRRALAPAPVRRPGQQGPATARVLLDRQARLGRGDAVGQGSPAPRRAFRVPASGRDLGHPPPWHDRPGRAGLRPAGGQPCDTGCRKARRNARAQPDRRRAAPGRSPRRPLGRHRRHRAPCATRDVPLSWAAPRPVRRALPVRLRLAGQPAVGDRRRHGRLDGRP